MANLQYIGPRVVPKPYRNPDTGNAEWKSGIEYEALTMVTYLSNGYVSAKPVPSSVGNPADNPDYWVESADFDAALSDLQNRVSDIENVTIPAINDRLDNLTTFKNIVVVADSFGHTPSASVNFIQSIDDFISPDNIYKTVEGAAGFITTGNDGHTLRQNYNTLVASLTSEQKDSIDLVIVVGGINDTRTGASTSDFNYAVSSMAKSIKTTFKNAIGIIAYNGDMFSTSIDTARKALKPTFRNGIISWAAANGCIGTYLDTVLQVGGAVDMTDGVHPSSGGANYIAQELMNIASGGTHLDLEKSWGQTPVNFVGGSLNAYYEIPAGAVLFNNAGSPITLNGSYTYIGTFDDVPVPIVTGSVLFKVDFATITLTDDSTQTINDLHLAYRNDGRIAAYRFGGTIVNVKKIETLISPTRAFINPLMDI